MPNMAQVLAITSLTGLLMFSCERVNLKIGVDYSIACNYFSLKSQTPTISISDGAVCINHQQSPFVFVHHHNVKESVVPQYFTKVL